MRRNILASADELKSLRIHIARRPFDLIYDMLRKRCSMTLESSPVSEGQWRSLSDQGAQLAGVKATRAVQGRIIDLLVAHHIDPNPAYRDRAIEELKNLLSWSAWLEPGSELPVDLCTAEAAVAAVVALDWLHDDLTEVDRLRVLHAIRHRVIDAYRKAVAQKAWWYNCYHSWNAVINSGCGLAALALSDEEPAARDAYSLARAGLKHFFDALGREGGWDEGLGYWGYALRYVLLLGEAAFRTTDDQSIFHSRGMDATGLFGVYFTPCGQYAGFGDTPAVPLYSALYLLVKHYGLNEMTWWLDTYAFHRDVSTTDWSAAGLAMLFRPPDVETPLAPDLQALKVFNEIGWAAMSDRWPRPGMYVAAKAGDLSANHSQRDMCSLLLQVDGEMLLHDMGLPPYAAQSADEPHGELYAVQAACHNTLLVGSRDHYIDAQGSIIEAQTGRDFRWLSCDGALACGENVHFVRHVVMLTQPRTQAGRMLLVLDEITNTAAEKIDLFWHSPGVISMEAGAFAGVLKGSRAAMSFAILSTASVHVKSLARQAAHRSDSILHVSVAPTARALIVSAFCREPLHGKRELKRANGGAVRIRIGDVAVNFKSLKKHLQLDDIAAQ